VSPEDLAAERDRDLAWVLSTPMGRRSLYRLAHSSEAAGLLRNPYVPDSNGVTYNVGRQSVGHWLLAECERVSPDLFERMMVEAHGSARRLSRPHVPPDGDSSPE
jgi:hypothetical protein